MGTLVGKKGKGRVVNVRIYDLKQEGGELFMNDFYKLWRYNEVQYRISDIGIQKAINQKLFKLIIRKSTVVFAIQLVVFISIVKNNLKADFKWVQG